MAESVKRCGFSAIFFRRLSLSMAVTLVMAGFFIACDTPMGLGDPVDTTPPTITIMSPYQGQLLGSLDLGDPIYITGTWEHEMGIKRLEVIITNVRNNKKFSNTLKDYTVNQNGTWEVTAVIPEPDESGEAEYKIQVLAWSGFSVPGSDDINVMIDIVPPWVDDALILRHPDPVYGTNFHQQPLREKRFYENLIDLNDDSAYRSIKYEDIDEFQNESFTLKVDISANISGIAASRLFVFDEDGKQLNPGSDPWGLVPSRSGNAGTPEARAPEWDISAANLIAWASAAGLPSFSKNAHYISFEIWAWNGTAWSGSWDTGTPIDPGDSSVIRKRKIGGTCWYPETDMPHIIVRADSGSGLVTLDQDAPLELEVYDDDKLSEIYAVLIKKDDYESPVYRGSQSDEEYLEALRNNTGGKRDVVLLTPNRFVSGNSIGDRWNRVDLFSSEPGEYRLLALAKDTKSVFGMSSTIGVWGVNTFLRVQIVNPANPITIIERPTENTFPALGGTGGRKFNFDGYTIDKTGTKYVQIAWYPVNSGKTRQDALTALNSTADDDLTYPFNGAPGASPYIVNDVRIWKLPVSPKEEIVLNGNLYMRNRFSKEFDIISDFMYGGTLENLTKQFVIYTRSETNANDDKDFRLSNYTERPIVDVIIPFRDLLVHNTKADLELHMRATERDVRIDPASLIITDVTAGNSNPNLGFISPDPDAPANEKKRMVPASVIDNNPNFTEGTQRTYRFEAADILGNRTQIDRRIIMSNLPALLYITSSNAAGTYGIGTELRFEAVFSMPVKVTGSPRLKVYFNDPLTGEPALNPGVNGFYASVVPSSVAANTVVFTYEVGEGIQADKLYTSLKSILSNDGSNGTMETTEAGGGFAKIEMDNNSSSLQNMKVIALDGIRPKITGATFGQTRLATDPWPEGDSYFNKGKTITLELHTDKEVRISGTPIAYLNIGSLYASQMAVFTRVTHEAGGSTIYFSYPVPDTVIADSSPVSWNGTLILDTANNITDMYGNPISLPVLDLSHRDGSYTTPRKRANVITNPPAVPTFSIFRTGAFTGEFLPANSDVIFNDDVYVKINSAPNTRLFYSVEGGNNPIPYTDGKVADADKANNIMTTYKPSNYQVTAWLEDYAGNRSNNAVPRNVTINSRAPELDAITCGQPNGAYQGGEQLTFRLAFSRQVTVKAGATAALTLKGTNPPSASPGITDQVVINLPVVGTDWAASSIVSFDYTVPTNQSIYMKDIKALKIEFTNVVDDFGNILKNYDTLQVTENASTRPLRMDAQNLNRPLLEVNTVRPVITAYNPAAPSTGSGSNGGLMTAGMNNTITLTFDKPVWANSGKFITVRPWGNWAVPPILTGTEMDALYNSLLFSAADRTKYQHRLYWVDPNGLPDLAGRTPDVAYADSNNWNYYIKNTQGLTNVGGNVRPDVSAKYVLAFQYDLYDGVDNLREVFNAAQWKWQIISTTSGSVQVDTGDRRIVTITLPEPLEPGRIWEVLMDDGAFRDQAGNGSSAIVSTTVAGEGYRFWSNGTAEPVIRVDRYSHGDNYHGVGLSFRGDRTTIPALDTKVRIDCETPGATVRYDIIQTKYTPTAASSAGGVFGSTGNAAAFFGTHPAVNTGNLGSNATTGYDNNTIGNGGATATGMANPPTPPTDSDGYFTGLLVPITVERGSSSLQNGAILYTALTGMGSGLLSGSNLNTGGTTLSYRTVSSVDGNVTYATPGANWYFYAGDQFNFSSETTTNLYDPKLQTARRDYVAAAAQKLAVNAGTFAGPGLDVSAPAYEGVFKTTLLYREPAGTQGMSWFMIEGFDTPTIPSTPGFPLQEFRIMPPAPYNSIELTYFTKQAYRIGGTVPTGAQTNWNRTYAQNATVNNNYIWVTWEIVSDFYQKGRSQVYNQTSFSRLQRAGYNYGAVLCTYGAITYRYRQFFDGGTNQTQ